MADNGVRAGCERTLVAQVLAGDDAAFTELVERYQRLVWHLVYRMVQQPEDCRELCQEVFFRVSRYLPQFRFESSLASWIGRIAFNVSARHLQRKRLPLQQHDDSQLAPVEQLADDFDLVAACADAELIAKLHQALQMLAPLPRTVLTLYYLEELSVNDVAIITDKPLGTVKSILFRARSQLRSQFILMGGADE